MVFWDAKQCSLIGDEQSHGEKRLPCFESSAGFNRDDGGSIFVPHNSNQQH